MTLRKASFISPVPSAFRNGSRFLAFLLALALAVPNPALALRTTEISQQEGAGLEELKKTLANSASGLEELIPDARIFLAMAHEPLRVRLEIGKHAFNNGLTEEMARQILRAASRENLQEVVEPDGSRSLYILLPSDHPWIVDGIPLDTFKLKQVTHRGTPPRMEAYVDAESSVRQPEGRLAFRGGKILSDPPRVRPVGGGYVDEAVNEYTTMLEAFRQKVPTGYPIGVGQFLDLTFQGKPMGFVVIAMRRVGDGNKVDARIGRTLRVKQETEERNIMRSYGQTEQGMQKVAKLYGRMAQETSDDLTAAAQTLYRLHQAGIVHSHPTLDQFRRRGKGDNSPPPIYDFTNAMSFRSMSRDEFIIRVFNDYRTMFMTTLAVFPGRPLEAPEYKRFLQIIRADRLPVERLAERYFPISVMRALEKKLAGVSIRDSSSYQEFSSWLVRSWRRDRLEKGVAWKELAHENALARVFEEYAGQLYDRLAQSAAPPTSGLEEVPVGILEDQVGNVKVTTRPQAAMGGVAGSAAEITSIQTLIPKLFGFSPLMHPRAAGSDSAAYWKEAVARHRKMLEILRQGGGKPEIEALFAAGMEEAGVKVYAKDELPEPLQALGREAPADRTHVVVAPNNPQAKLDSLVIDLYVHANVANEADRLLSILRSRGARIEHTFILPSDPVETNAVLRAAAQSQAQGRSVIIALDKNLMDGLQVPTEHPVVLLLDLLTRETIDPARLAAFLAQPKALVDLILDLTSGSIQPVKIQSRDFFVVYA